VGKEHTMTAATHTALTESNIDTENTILFPAVRWLIAETNATAEGAFEAASDMEADILKAILTAEYSLDAAPFSLDVWMTENVLGY
jgi:hypothetical protein